MLLFINLDIPVPFDILEHPVLVAIIKLLVHSLDILVMSKYFFPILHKLLRECVICKGSFNCCLDWQVILGENHMFPHTLQWIKAGWSR